MRSGQHQTLLFTPFFSACMLSHKASFVNCHNLVKR
nr:MAG TPA: hypothetical protein [Caudoviricetes sp.]